MANWVEMSHHDARTKFVAHVVRMFGSISSPDFGAESENANWNEAVANSSTYVKNKLDMLGVGSLEDANVAMYTCIVAISRYKWGMRGPAASTKRV